MSARYRRHPDLRLTALGAEGVALHLGSRRYFTVSGSALLMLEALQDPRSPEELVALLTARYDVTADHARDSVETFLARCRDAGFLESVDLP